MLVTIIYIGGVLMTDNDYVNLITSTAYWIKRSELTNTAYYNLRSKLSVVNFSDQEVPIAFFEITEPYPYVVIPKISRELLDHIVGRKLMFEICLGEDGDIVEYKEPPFKPLPHQIDIINEISKLYDSKVSQDKRAVLALQAGGGKSFISANLVKHVGQKFIFIVYSKKLVRQTWESFKKYLGKDGMCMLERGSDFEELDWSRIKGLFLSQSMLRSLFKTYGEQYVLDTIQYKMGATIKIIDEFDREVGMFYKLEAFSNFKYSLYLTGTAYKSLKPDDAVFQTVIRSALKSGGKVKLESQRICYVVNYNFKVAPDEYFKLNMRDEKLFKTYFNDHLAQKDLILDYIMQKFYKDDNSVMKRSINEGYQIVFFCGRIEHCEGVKNKLIKNFGISENDIGVYNSSINEKDKLVAETKPFIMTTCESMGRGYDNDKLRVLVFLEFSFSSSVFSQSVSRTSRTGTNYESYIIYPNATDQYKCSMNLRKKMREGLFERYFKKTEFLTVPESYYGFYVYGYREDSERGKFLIEKRKNKKVKLSKKIF